MKAGTTSLCRDLESQSSIFFPSVKEPHTLTLDSVTTESGRSDYSALFVNAEDHQLCGEGSTGYTKLPVYEGVPERAWEVIGPDLKLIYIIRDPVARALSHHYHLYRAGRAPASFEKSLQTIAQLTDVSRYAMQLKPWIERFGRKNIYVVIFESYVQDRTTMVSRICHFLGVDHQSDRVDTSIVYNAATEQLLPPPCLRDPINAMTRSQWYKRVVHPKTPQWMRDWFKAAFYRSPRTTPELPGLDVINRLIVDLEADLRELRVILNHETSVWDAEEMRNRFNNNEWHLERPGGAEARPG